MARIANTDVTSDVTARAHLINRSVATVGVSFREASQHSARYEEWGNYGFRERKHRWWSQIICEHAFWQIFFFFQVTLRLLQLRICNFVSDFVDNSRLCLDDSMRLLSL